MSAKEKESKVRFEVSFSDSFIRKKMVREFHLFQPETVWLSFLISIK